MVTDSKVFAYNTYIMGLMYIMGMELRVYLTSDDLRFSPDRQILELTAINKYRLYNIIFKICTRGKNVSNNQFITSQYT